MSLLIKDQEAVFTPLNVPTGLGNTPRVTARPNVSPFSVLVSGSYVQDLSRLRVASMDSNRNWYLNLPWPSESQPSGVQWTIVRSDGTALSGTVPEGVAGPVTVAQLLSTYAWAYTTLPAPGSVQAFSLTALSLTAPQEFIVTGSPSGNIGTIGLAWANEAGNTFFAAPSGSTGVPGFRALVAADIPNIDAGSITTGTLALARLSGITATQLSATAAILGSQLSATAGIVHGQIASVDAAALLGTVPSANLALTASDIPNLDASKITTGTLPPSIFPAATYSTQGVVKQTVYNVKDYGALGDGSTNDTTAIQNACNAAATAGGGIVYLPPGTYLVGYQGPTPAWNNPTCIRLGQAVQLVGAGKATSILKLAPNSNCAVVSNAQANAYYDNVNNVFPIAPTQANAEYVAIRDLGIDGQKSNGMVKGPTVAPTLSVTSGSPSVDVGTHIYAWSYQTSTSESTIGALSGTANVTVTGQQVTVGNFSALPVGGGRIGTGVNLYRTVANSVAPLVLVHQFTWADVDTILAGSGTWVDTVADSALSQVARMGNGIYLGMNPPAPTVANGVDTEYDPHQFVNNVYVQNCVHTGFYQYGLSATDYIACHSYNCDQYAFRPSADCSLTACHAGRSGLHGFYIEVSAVRLAGCKAFFAGMVDVTQGNGFFLNNAYGINISGCEAQDNKTSGFSINGANNCDINGTADSNSRRGAGQAPAVDVFNSSYNVLNIRCFDRGSTTQTQNVALRLRETGGGAPNVSIGNVIKIDDTYIAVSGGYTAVLPTNTIDTGSKAGLAGNFVTVSQQDAIHNTGSISGTFTPDVYFLGGHVYATVTGNLTIAAPAHPTSTSQHWGVGLEFVLTASGGPYSLTWNPIYSTDSTDPNVSSIPAGSTLRVEFVWNGTNWVQKYKAEGGSNLLKAVQLTGTVPSANLALIASDIPSLDAAKITTGTFSSGLLPIATGAALGAIKVGPGLSIASGVLSTVNNGTVTSVAMTVPADFGISGSAITSSGTLGLTWNSQTGNVVMASPSGGGAGTPTFRSLVAGDIPSLNANKITTGTLALAQGGTNADSTSITGNKVFASPDGTTGAVTYRSLVAADIPNLDAGKITTGTIGLARLSGITTTQLDAAAGILSGQIASLDAAKLTGTVPLGTLSGITTTQLSATAGIVAGQLAVSSPTSGQIGGLTTSNLSASAGLVAAQIASVNPSVLTGSGTIPLASNTPSIASSALIAAYARYA